MEKPAEETNGQWHGFVDVSTSQPEERCTYIYPYASKKLTASQENRLAWTPWPGRFQVQNAHTAGEISWPG